MSKKVLIIGSGFSSMAAACYLAKGGYTVTILEKNEQLGGRARQLKKDGFTFDMGPTWYWMPDVFERFFGYFDKKPSDYYNLRRLDPAYRVYFGTKDFITIADNLDAICDCFEQIEPGSGAALKRFMTKAAANYEIAIKDLVYRPGESPLELVTPVTIQKLGYFIDTIKKMVRREFKNPKLAQILEFPVLFLGATPANTPAFYNFMNQADFGLGTWHPMGGMYEVISAMKSLATELGVHFEINSPIEKIKVNNGVLTGVETNKKTFRADVVLSGADYHHTETLLDPPYRTYTESYWDSRTYAPSALIFYIGFNKKLADVSHHMLFFDVDFDRHAHAIYKDPKWPDEPLFYVSFPSVTDSNAAPEGMESGIFLIPLAPGIEDTLEHRKLYFDKIIDRFETITQQSIRESVIFKESFCINNFVNDYNSYKGNAYGLANTLLQTAFLRPKLRSRKVKGLYFTGQLTVPGPGVPPSLISGKLVSDLISKYNPIGL